MSSINFAFLGTSEFAVKILEKLIENGYIPGLVVTAPDKKKGRKMILTPPPVKVFAQKHNLKIIQPEKLSHLDIQCPSGGYKLSHKITKVVFINLFYKCIGHQKEKTGHQVILIYL